MDRIERVNELITQQIAEILLELGLPTTGAFVTVLSSKTSETLENTTINISVFPENLTGTTLEELNDEIAKIQKILNRRISLKFVPKIMFKLDTSIRHADTIGKVLDRTQEK